jgi:hypothetical protein
VKNVVIPTNVGIQQTGKKNDAKHRQNKAFKTRRASRDLLDSGVRRNDGKYWSSFQRMRFYSSN